MSLNLFSGSTDEDNELTPICEISIGNPVPISPFHELGSISPPSESISRVYSAVFFPCNNLSSYSRVSSEPSKDLDRIENSILLFFEPLPPLEPPAPPDLDRPYPTLGNNFRPSLPDNLLAAASICSVFSSATVEEI